MWYALLSALGCGSEHELGSLAEEARLPEPEFNTDEFEQTPEPVIDVLFIIDDSGSMGNKQTSLSNNLPRFFSNITGTVADYHIGVTTTDMDATGLKGRLRPVWGFERFSPGAGTLVSRDERDAAGLIEDFRGLGVGFRFLHAGTQALIDARGVTDADGAPLTTLGLFKSAVKVGTDGSGNERGLEAALSALLLYQDPGEENAGFWRDSAPLHIILVSDEEDHSFENAPGELIDTLSTLAVETGKNVEFHSIVAMENDGCSPDYYIGSRYLEVSDAFDSFTGSICATDWDETLDGLGQDASGLEREFFLTRPPIEETITAAVYGAAGDLLYEPDVGDREFEPLEYVPASNSVRFKSLDSVPPAGSVLKIDYEVDVLEERAAQAD